MWQSSNPRSKAAGAARKRNQDRDKGGLHLRRVQAELKAIGGLNIGSALCKARILLSDLSPTGVGIWASQPMMVGQEVALTVEDPKRFYIKGRVTWCQEQDHGNNVISDVRFKYRMGVEFLFQSEQEQAQVRAYCEELAAQNLLFIAA